DVRRAMVGRGILIAILLLTGTFCPVGKRSHYACSDCGLYSQDRVMFGIPMPIHERRPRTDWYDSRIGAPHPHRRSKSSCTAGLRLWLSPTYFACGTAEPLILWEGWVLKVPLRLGPLGLEVKYHQELTHASHDHREPADESWKRFDPDGKDEEVRRW